MSIIEARNLQYTYPDGTLGIKGAKITVKRGERIAIIGANGSGKSTLAEILGGLREPKKGSIRFFGEKIEDLEETEIRRKIGVLLQDPDETLFSPTVREDLEFGPAQLKMSKKETEEKIQQVIKTMGIPEKILKKHPSRLSGGQKQKSALASVLTFDPEVLILDEPFATLDPNSKSRIIQHLNSLWEKGKTIILATQELRLLPSVTDKIYLLGKKKIVAEGKVREILTDTQLLRNNGLAPPPAVQLGLKLKMKEKPLTLEEAVKMLPSIEKEKLVR